VATALPLQITADSTQTALFCGVAQRVVGISYRRFGTTVPTSGFKNPKESLQPQHGVYTGKNVGGKNVSVVWCQPVGLLQVVGWRAVWWAVVRSHRSPRTRSSNTGVITI